MQWSILIAMILIIGAVQAAKITVGPSGEDFSGIQQAIDNASPGDTIEVHSGTYWENPHVYKSLSLIGIDTGKGLPVVNASGLGSVVTIEGNGSVIRGFNLTNSGHCQCGNAGILVKSNNDMILGNILYKNKYGIFIRTGYINNTIISNDFLENEIATIDPGNNRWNGTFKAKGIQALVELVTGRKIKGNHYSDYDESNEGCNDTNSDGICDSPRRIDGGSSIDAYSLISLENS
jgi:parallel beta-helix repeat protein